MGYAELAGFVAGEVPVMSEKRVWDAGRKVRLWLVRSAAAMAGLAAIAVLLAAPAALAQSYGAVDGFLSLPVEEIRVEIANPSAHKALNDRVTDTFRTTLALYPGDRYSEDQAAFAISRTRRSPDVADITYEYALGPGGGLIVTFTITLGKGPGAETGRGFLISSSSADLPVLYDRDGTYVRVKLEALSLYYGNDNAWYGRPDMMLAGNPLVKGEPAGEGYDDWLEGYVHYGLYGITPLSDNFYVYGGLSGITSGSRGQELFTDFTRGYTGVEDAYAGFITGKTDEKGNRLAFNFSAGRQRFTLANGFLFANTAANGDERAALQANARWASDMLVQGQFVYNNTRLSLFYLDPDELPVVDSKSKYVGANLQGRPLPGLMLAASYIHSPESDFGYFGPDGQPIGTREGLSVFDARFTYSPKPAGLTGPFIGGEAALQTHSEFDMLASAGYAEAGYRLPELPWSPVLSYRLSYFSGDDPDTGTYERWDPLLSGGNGEQWVQGANHFKIVQDSNVIAHRFQGSFRPLPAVELVPQFWIFQADSENNIGGNPALSVLDGHDYGYEANMTVKWFASRNWYVHGHVAYTWPGEAVQDALDGDYKDWFSAMLFVRYAL
jgi:hypothetical protein